MKKLLPIILSIGMTTGWASQNSQPYECPSVNVIKSIGVSKVGSTCDRKNYIAVEENQYDTSFTWAFIIGLFPVDQYSSEQILAEGNKLLTTLSGNPVPNAAGMCEYNIAANHIALAFPVNLKSVSYKNLCIK